MFKEKKEFCVVYETRHNGEKGWRCGENGTVADLAQGMGVEQGKRRVFVFVCLLRAWVLDRRVSASRSGAEGGRQDLVSSDIVSLGLFGAGPSAQRGVMRMGHHRFKFTSFRVRDR